MWVGGVRVVILDKENRILLVKQHHEERDIWLVPGGGIEDGETSADAGKREVFEETGLEINIKDMIWHVEEVNDERGQRFVDYMLGEIVSGIPELGKDPEFDCNNQILREIKYFTKDELSHCPDLYPEELRNELWEVLEKKNCNPYKIRN
ncbi:MAG: NUDIX hydrolase [Peptostreptococcaceae bacterium]|nr:NUDIX hydrolase [Peptostreptococcaceae bacterium]